MKGLPIRGRRIKRGDIIAPILEIGIKSNKKIGVAEFVTKVRGHVYQTVNWTGEVRLREVGDVQSIAYIGKSEECISKWEAFSLSMRFLGVEEGK